MATTTVNRQLLVQLQVGVGADGQPKLQNRLFAHIDPAVTEAQMTQVLNALTPLFQNPVFKVGFIDTLDIIA